MTRLLFVHAHPDDETLTCGVAMAHHVAAGDDVHVLTCTLGEEGEVIPPGLAHLEGAPGDPLGPHRRAELAEATTRLGVAVALLGDAPGSGPAYRDSGMAGMPSARHPRALTGAPLAEVAGLVARHVRSLRPDVVVTYDRQGGYGHPDHIRTHDATRAALALLAREDPATLPERVFEIRTPHSWAREDRLWLAAHVDPAAGLSVPTPAQPYPPGVVDDGLVSHVVVDLDAVTAQAAALEAHATQVTVHATPTGERYYALSNDIATRLSGREGYARVDPVSWADVPRAGETWVEGLLA